jgi:hypothetical protein
MNLMKAADHQTNTYSASISISSMDFKMPWSAASCMACVRSKRSRMIDRWNDGWSGWIACVDLNLPG